MSDDQGDTHQANKSHHKRQKGAKAKKRDKIKPNADNDMDAEAMDSKLAKTSHKDADDNYQKAKLRNPKAFALQSFVAAERQFRRTQDIKAKRLQLPEVDRSALEPPPIMVAIVGPPRVGKSILMQSLIKNYTRQKLNSMQGPVTVVTGKSRRVTFYECPNDLNSMIDTAKVADLVLLMIDASFGFEMETFEFLNICQVHGFPRIMGVLTHMDSFKNPKALKKTKKKLKHRFWTEIYQGAKLFYLTGLVGNEYRRNEIHNLARFISVMKFKDLGFRLSHPFVVCDRMEDLTPPDLIRQNDKCDRNVCLYGYVRGSALKNKANVHIPGVGDFVLQDVSMLADPCPLPDKEKKRTLDDRERLVYAPFSGVGGIIYDKDAVYIELGGSHSHSHSTKDSVVSESKNPLLNQVIASKNTLDSKLTSAKLKVFSDGQELANADLQQQRETSNLDEEGDEEESQSSEQDEEEEEEIDEEDFESDEDEDDEDEEEDGSDSDEEEDDQGSFNF
jgi:ribosome biogenesis protein BMS1